MIRPRRNLSIFLGALGYTALFLSSTLSAQQIDNRPIYYVMLKSLEDAFQDYNVDLTEQLNTRASRMRKKYEADLLAITKKLDALESDRVRDETAFNDDREVLNQRIEAINEQMTLRDGRINEERRIQKHHLPRYANDPRIKMLKERVAEGLAEIDAARTSYLTQLTATEKARDALTRQIEEYVSAGDPLALEIRSLDEDWQHFAESERRKLKQLADVYAIDYAAYEKWLQAERADLEEMRTTLASAQATDGEQRALHAQTQKALQTLIDEYNALVEIHNKADADDPNRDDRAMKFASLEDRIAELQATLSRARDAVINVTEEIKQRNQELAERYERFASAKRARDATLAADLAEINATRLAVEAVIEKRRQEVDAQIQSLEAHISAELRDARSNLEALNTRLVDSFGRDHEGFDTAITRVLESNDDSLLYTATGTPRFDLSRPVTASVYTAVDRLEAERSEMDARIAAIEKSEGSAPLSAAGQTAMAGAGALERDLAALRAERQQLLEAYAASARRIQAERSTLEQRRRALEARFAHDRAALGALYSARAGLTRSEMQAIQGVLVAAVKGLPGARSESESHLKLLNALREKAGNFGEPVDESLLAPHALMDWIASKTPEEAAAARFDAFAPFAARKTTSSRELDGADKAALARAWLAKLRRQARFADIGRELDASAAVNDAGQALSNLFMAGVIDHTMVTEQRLDDGGIGIQLSVLGRDYQLGNDGSLELLPKG